jgi:GTP cyclohydrolase I
MATEQRPIQREHSCDAAEPGVQCANSDRMSDDAAEHAVKKVFAILGVDIDRPESVEEFREDLRFGRKMRKVADHGLLAFFGVVAVAFAAAVWAGIVSNIKH